MDCWAGNADFRIERPKGAIDAAYHGTNESNFTTKVRVRNQSVSLG